MKGKRGRESYGWSTNVETLYASTNSSLTTTAFVQAVVMVFDAEQDETWLKWKESYSVGLHYRVSRTMILWNSKSVSS